MFGGFGGLIFFLKMLLLIWTEWGAKQGRALVINGKRQQLSSIYSVPGIAQIYLYVRLNSHNNLYKLGTLSPFYRKKVSHRQVSYIAPGVLVSEQWSWEQNLVHSQLFAAYISQRTIILLFLFASVLGSISYFSLVHIFLFLLIWSL